MLLRTMAHQEFSYSLTPYSEVCICIWSASIPVGGGTMLDTHTYWYLWCVFTCKDHENKKSCENF